MMLFSDSISYLMSNEFNFAEINFNSELKANELCYLKDVWHSHEQLSTAIEELNCLYSMQLLFWMMIITFNIISKFYVFLTVKTLSTLAIVREVLHLIHYVKLLVSLVAVCHITAEEVGINF